MPQCQPSTCAPVRESDDLAFIRAWGGNSGPTWFYDLSAGPDWDDNSYDVDDADLDGDGVAEYRIPPIWEYGNTTAYRPFADLSGSLIFDQFDVG